MFNNGDLFEFAVCGISTGEFFIGNSNNIVDDIVRISPAELIYPNKISENKDILSLKEIFKTTSIHEKLYERTNIFEIKQSVFGLDLEKDFDNNAVSLLACYLSNTQRDSKISFRYPYKFENKDLLLIDSSTWRSLEIDSSLNENSICLLDILDKTNTAFGARKLRYYIRNLSRNLDVISERQSHIKHIINDHILIKDIDLILSKIPDINTESPVLTISPKTELDLTNIEVGDTRVEDFIISANKDVKILSVKFENDIEGNFEIARDLEKFEKVTLNGSYEIYTALENNKSYLMLLKK